MWRNTQFEKPPFSLPVLVFCRIYGRYITTYEQIIDDYEAGNWVDHEGRKGGLPPTHWQYLPDFPPKEK